MKKIKQELDIPLIKKQVKESHLKFIEKYGLELDKVTSDHNLFVEIALAKIKCIVKILIDEKVIDSFDIIEFGNLKKIILKSDKLKNYVEILTNGVCMTLETPCDSIYGETLEHILFASKKYCNINDANFNWNGFSVELLDYIQEVVYERKEVTELKIFKN